jgi:hypothetical protein
VTSPRQDGSDTSVSTLNKGLSVLGGLVLFWLSVGSVVWVFTWNGTGGEGSQPGVSINSTTPSQPGGFGGTTSQSQPGGFSNTSSPQQPQSPTPSINGQAHTIPAQK